MKEDQGLIAGVIGKSPVLTRPSYGSMPGLNEALRNKVVENGLKVWDWTIDSLDWKYNKMPVDAKHLLKLFKTCLLVQTSQRKLFLCMTFIHNP
ncbi:hypothetical protein ACUC2M_14045 [Bacillus cytotoxicus]